MENDVFTVELYAASGVKIISSKTNIALGDHINTIDMPPGLSTGVYIITITNSKGNSIYTSKFFKS